MSACGYRKKKNEYLGFMGLVKVLKEIWITKLLLGIYQLYGALLHYYSI